jgi:hypothetical protein
VRGRALEAELARPASAMPPLADTEPAAGAHARGSRWRGARRRARRVPRSRSADP